VALKDQNWDNDHPATFWPWLLNRAHLLLSTLIFPLFKPKIMLVPQRWTKMLTFHLPSVVRFMKILFYLFTISSICFYCSKLLDLMCWNYLLGNLG
jgi:hypothetical protein